MTCGNRWEDSTWQMWKQTHMANYRFKMATIKTWQRKWNDLRRWCRTLTKWLPKLSPRAGIYNSSLCAHLISGIKILSLLQMNINCQTQFIPKVESICNERKSVFWMCAAILMMKVLTCFLCITLCEHVIRNRLLKVLEIMGCPP